MAVNLHFARVYAVIRHQAVAIVLAFSALGLAGCGMPVDTGEAGSATASASAAASASAGASTPATRSPAAPTSPSQAAPPQISYTVVASYPHDPSAWTQGLAYAGPGRLYEGTGDYAKSSLREVELPNGEILRQFSLPDPQMYGEGITVLNDTIVQLTWRDGLGLVYNRDDFALVGQFRYPGAGGSQPREGWGITTDGTNLFVSDGSSSVYLADAQRTMETGELAVTQVLQVQWQGRPVIRLNELEYVDGQIYANVWQTDQIVRFDAATGEVTAQLDLSGLLTPEEKVQAESPNGIAHEPVTDELLVTGKYWPKLFALRLG